MMASRGSESESDSALVDELMGELLVVDLAVPEGSDGDFGRSGEEVLERCL